MSAIYRRNVMVGSRFLTAVQAFRQFLLDRSGSTWAVADAREVREASTEAVFSGALVSFARSRAEPHQVWALDTDTGETCPLLHEYDLQGRRLEASNIVYLFSRFALFFFRLEDADLCRFHYALAAAPDEAALKAGLDGFADHVLRFARASSDIHVIGDWEVKVDRRASWDDLVLSEELKSDIRRNVEKFLGGREAYDRLGLPYKRGFLFVGPPGNGKSLLCRVTISQTKLPSVYMLCQPSYDDKLGEAFFKASRLAPSILVFEDIDTLFEAPGKMSYFLNLMDGLRTVEGVLTLATTNHPESIDPALLKRPGRFDRVWLIGNPDVACRRIYLARFFGSGLSPEEIVRLARETDGFSYAHMRELYISAAYAAADSDGKTVGMEHAVGALSLLRKQLQAGSDLYEVETIGFAPREEEKRPRPAGR